MKTVEVTLVRHAQTVANDTGTWQGQGDSALSERGRGQADAFGRRFADAVFDRVVASDLRRTRDTVAVLDRRDVAFEEAWREIDVGRWEGLTRDEVQTRFGDEIAQLKQGLPVRIGGGESWLDLEQRVDAAFDRLVQGLADGERALVMTHGGVIHALVSGLLGLRGRRFRPIGRIMNTGVTRLRLTWGAGHGGGRVEIGAFNDASHVGPRSEYLTELLADGAAALAVVAADGTATPALIEEVRGWYPELAPEPIDLGMAPLELGGLARLAVPGGVHGLVAGPRDAAHLARAVLGQTTGAAPDVAELPAGRLAHVVWTRAGAVLGDYGLAPR